MSFTPDRIFVQKGKEFEQIDYLIETDASGNYRCLFGPVDSPLAVGPWRQTVFYAKQDAVPTYKAFKKSGGGSSIQLRLEL